MRQDLANRILSAATARLGEPVTLSRGSSTYSLRGIFSETFSEVDVDTGLSVTSKIPSLTINSADIEITPKGNDRVTVADGRSFMVRETRPDGEGGIVLLMYLAQTNNYL
tara:strand:+ start:1468 stop:1797 length:330 start_codon:yes stop_codon:yes gene_type:complete